ncbi:MAG: hypothetical protein K1X56_04875 [Flavobacteriales bacterium]|nr:hypothetical protein [Flavobacteriales bacterium]
MNLKKSISNFILIIAIAMGVSCGNRETSEPQTEESDSSKILQEKQNALEAEILDQIDQLPEVKKRREVVDSITKGEHQLISYIAMRPTDGEDHYWVEVSEDNGDVLVNHFHFFYYPAEKTIRYYDPIEDQILELEEWRSDTLHLGGAIKNEKDYNF